MAHPEDILHRDVARLLAAIIGPPGKASRDGVTWFSIEHRNARSEIEGAFRKARGVVAGIPDIMIVDYGPTFWIELKASKGSLSSAQRAMHATLEACGQSVFVCRSIDSVMAVLRTCGVPTREVMA